MDKSYYDVGMACLNGHSVNSSSQESPQYNAAHCDQCGEKTIQACTHCNSPIRGHLHNTGVISLAPWNPPAYCHDCGKPYPWTLRKIDALADAIDLAERLSPDEKEKLKQSIPDILQETPRTDTAVSRFKSAIAKAGQAGGKLIYNVALKVATDAIVKSLG